MTSKQLADKIIAAMDNFKSSHEGTNGIRNVVAEVIEQSTYPQSEYDEIFKTIIEIKKKMPHLRFSQIVVNCGSPTDDVFYIEDKKLSDRLKYYLKIFG